MDHNDPMLTQNLYRYRITAQNFTLEDGRCLLCIQDTICNNFISLTTEVLFNNDDFLEQMSVRDIKMVGYIYASEIYHQRTV